MARTAQHQNPSANWIWRDKLYSSYCIKAADAAEANSQQAFETAQKLSNQLRAAEDRIAALEVEIQHCREKSERAEGWFSKIATEIEDRLIIKPKEMRRQMSRRG